MKTCESQARQDMNTLQGWIEAVVMPGEELGDIIDRIHDNIAACTGSASEELSKKFERIEKNTVLAWVERSLNTRRFEDRRRENMRDCLEQIEKAISRAKSLGIDTTTYEDKFKRIKKLVLPSYVNGILSKLDEQLEALQANMHAVQSEIEWYEQEGEVNVSKFQEKMGNFKERAKKVF